MQNTNENNKLIAEFMHLELISNKEYVIKRRDMIKQDITYNLPLTSDDLKYNSCWNWLMPVINKCYQEHLSKHFDANLILSIAGAVMNCDKDKAYKVVLEFIKEYNQNK